MEIFVLAAGVSLSGLAGQSWVVPFLIGMLCGFIAARKVG